jgi:glycosyltransferase involved in cell wall biosynthesis
VNHLPEGVDVGYPTVPEIVAHGWTGLIADSVEDLVTAVKRVEAIDRQACRREVEDRFSAARMVTDYERFYRRLAGA